MPSPKKPIATFKSIPKIEGFEDINGQLYILCKITPWSKKDGSKSNLLTWVTCCSECDSPFAEKTCMTIYWINKKCPLHRKINRRNKKAQERRLKYAIDIFRNYFT